MADDATQHPMMAMERIRGKEWEEDIWASSPTGMKVETFGDRRERTSLNESAYRDPRLVSGHNAERLIQVTA